MSHMAALGAGAGIAARAGSLPGACQASCVVPAYTLTVVRGGRCWQVWHRFSDWIELDRQISKRLRRPLVTPHPLGHS